ncbi:hypothetical protein [Pelolinea submarina]|uniref:Uncharacterized protein n=1 Tax=Pelolinea submarina TaxID=913107 RepID=A0A3E0AJ48_9CHLR|nr:hypothetical protein [Pelolinea submarina]REG11661.1 hypothetical protein DFR64_1553 [Pelolinea submarina]
MKSDVQGTKVQCPFDGKLEMPGRCIACGQPTRGKKWQITTTNFLRNHKYIFKFPICDDCAEAQARYVNVKPINIISVIIVLLTIVSFLQPSVDLSPVLYNLGGAIWLSIVIAYTLWMNMKAWRENTAEVAERNSVLKSAVRFEKVEMPRKKQKGQAIIWFTSSQFARDFIRLNKGQVL